MAIKMVVVDLDGTALRSDQSILESTIKAFQKLKENNIITVVATGRVTYESMFVKEALDIDYMITANGSVVYDYKKDCLVFENYISSENSIKILDAISEHKESLSVMFLNEMPYCIAFESIEKTKAMLLNGTFPDNYVEVFSKYFNYTLDYASLLNDKSNKVHKICLDTLDNQNALKNILDKLKDTQDVKALSVFKNIVDFVPSKVDKGNALQTLASYLNIEMSDILAIGDNYNDIEMLEVSGTSIAMGNAKDEVKAISDYVVASNNEDGIFEAIDKYVFGAM